MSNFDSTIAMEEGWCITNGTNDSNDKWRLTKFDEMDSFTIDENVWEFVHSLAEQGSFYHQSAINFLEKECPEEFERIETHYYYVKG
jgi:hypothetical protein